ncbi:MAG: HK97 gp10 family phage protein [Croceimicrobium sp.]
MITGNVSNRDLNNLSKKLRFAGKKIKVEVAQDLAEGALNIRNEALVKAPFKDNRLTGSIQIEKKRNNGLLWQVGTNVSYAPYMEFGTGRLVSLDALLRAGLPASYAAQFKGKGVRQVNIQPRPFLFPAYNNEVPRLKKRIALTLEKNGKQF